MQVLVANASVSMWTLMSLDVSQMAEMFPQLRRFFDNGYTLNRLAHGDNVVGLSGHYNDIRVNLETGDFQ